MKFIDSNIFAYAFYNNEFTEKCQQAIKKGGITNTLNLIEAFFIIEKQTDQETAIKCIKSILSSHIDIINVDIVILFESIKKISNHNLSIFDMIHYVTASINNCESIITYDTDFKNLQIPREEPD